MLVLGLVVVEIVLEVQVDLVVEEIQVLEMVLGVHVVDEVVLKGEGNF